MSKESLASKAHPSYAVAIEIANACPEALFCGFKTKPKADGTHAKIPVSKNGTGVGADIDHDQLVNCSLLNQMIYPPNGADYWGIFMQSRMTYDPFNELVLTILDLDTKRSTAPRDIRMVKLMDQAKERGLLTERSHSKKGGHIIFLAKPDETLPPKIDLGNHQEIEIFGHPGSAGKNVMLTGDSMRGNLIELGCTVKEFLATAGIQIQEPKPAPPNQSFDFTKMLSKGGQSDFDKAVDALNAINPDIDYEDWIAIGQALHSEFGEHGRNAWYYWSSLGSKYQGEKDLESHWKSFGKKDGVKLGTLYKHAMDHGWQQPTKQTERKSAVEGVSLREYYYICIMAIKVIHKKLGRQMADGLAFKDEKEIHIDERLKKKEYILTVIHELLHICFPEMSEKRVDAASKKICNELWKLKIRRTDG